jgi:hypothetical protein
MRLFWLAYRQKGIACVLILQASSLISARLKASLQIDGIDEHFARAGLRVGDLHRQRQREKEIAGDQLCPARPLSG